LASGGAWLFFHMLIPDTRPGAPPFRDVAKGWGFVRLVKDSLTF
jgi:hypothetical protein